MLKYKANLEGYFDVGTDLIIPELHTSVIRFYLGLYTLIGPLQTTCVRLYFMPDLLT